MKLALPPTVRRGTRAFTMVEIAISLAVVAFAMVAILGVLPTGLQVQRDNREETIINQDGTYLLEAIRTGNDHLGLLSNAVYYVGVGFHDGTREDVNNESGDLGGQQIIGLLSTPRSLNNTGISNVVAWVRALNGTAVDLDPDGRDLAFRYEVRAEIQPFIAYPPGLTNSVSTNELARLWRLQGGLHEIRLTLRWPLFRDSVNAPENARVGTRRRTFRALVAGSLVPYSTNIYGRELMVYYFQPSIY